MAKLTASDEGEDRMNTTVDKDTSFHEAALAAAHDIRQLIVSDKPPYPKQKKLKEVPGKLEMFEGKLLEVKNPDRSGWWRFNDHYDRDGYCDNPTRGY